MGNRITSVRRRRSTRPAGALHRSAAAVLCLLLGMPLAAVAAAPATAAPSPAGAAGGGIIAAYSLAAPAEESASGLVARVVLPAGARCPRLAVDRRTAGRVRTTTVSMAERTAPASTRPAFDPILVCSAAIPVGSIDVRVGGRRLPAHLPSRVDRLALLGDSGCRIVAWEVQDCASTADWPLARIAQSVADEAPDAIVFNGDFFYREAPCPTASQSLCGSSPPPLAEAPFTDSAYGWIADALLPMAPMLGVAPLIVTRGNHEACNRGGNGYFLLFDPREGTAGTCAPVSTPDGLAAAGTLPSATYAIDLTVAPGRTLRLAVVDSAGGSDTQVTAFSAVQRPAYEAAARLSARIRGRESWLLTHRPVYGYATTTYAQPGIPFSPWTSMDQSAAAFGLLDTYGLVVSSHLHLAQAVQLPGYPAQLVMGNAGTLLDPAGGYALPTSGLVVAAGSAYPAPDWAWVAVRFGYAIATPNDERGSWRIQMKDPSGAAFAGCGLRNREVYCVDRAAG